MDVVPDPISPGPGTYDVIKATQIKPASVSMRQKLPDFCKDFNSPQIYSECARPRQVPQHIRSER